MSEECVHGYLQQWCLICETSKQTSLTKPIKTIVKTVSVEPIDNSEQLPIAYCVDLEEDALIEASKILGLEPTDVKFLNTPLYAHPMRELTDEEYKQLMTQWDEWRQTNDEEDTLRMFVDLILKKASEK
jgi:hypothetical protein